MSENLVIEKGIPVPESRTRRKYPLGEMEVGDSFFVPVDPDQSLLMRRRIGGHIQHFRSKHAATHFVVRSVDGGLRVWRLE